MNLGAPLPDSPWGPMLGAYFILIGLATGLSLMSGWMRPRDAEPAEAFEWCSTWVALIALALCVLILIIDLGQPGRFFLMLTRFRNTASVMAWGAKLIALEGALLASWLYLLHRRRVERRAGGVEAAEDTLTRFMYAAVPGLLGVISVGLACYPALLLSRTWVAPLAANPGSSALFLATSLVMGAACAALISLFAPGAADAESRTRAERTLLFLVAAEGALILISGLGLRGGRQEWTRVLEALVSGEAAAGFWGAVMGLGLGVPLALLLLVPKRRAIVTASALATLIGAGAARYLMFSIH